MSRPYHNYRSELARLWKDGGLRRASSPGYMATFARQKKKKRTAIARAQYLLELLPPPPCEAPCPHYEKCKTELLACREFSYYAKSKTMPMARDGSDSRTPARWRYNRIFGIPGERRRDDV